jgi:hypothetical protein
VEELWLLTGLVVWIDNGSLARRLIVVKEACRCLSTSWADINLVKSPPFPRFGSNDASPSISHSTQHFETQTSGE